MLTAVLTAVLTLALVGLLTGCGPGECIEAERAEYPELERLAGDVLSEVRIETYRLSSCEEIGQPGAAVAAKVHQWRSNKESRAYLRERGWVPDHGRMLSPDRRYIAAYYGIADDNTWLWAEVRFYLAPTTSAVD